MSDSDLESGDEVLPSLNEMLRKADFVVVCLTADNWKAPWIFYEVGLVFGKSEEKAKVCPYVIDLGLRLRDVSEPLNQFKAVKANKKGTFNLVRRINKELGYPLNVLELETTFDSKWPDLEKVIDEVQLSTNSTDPRLCVKDWTMVNDCIESHQDRVELRLRDCIAIAIDAAQSESYNHEKMVDMAWREIEESIERFSDKKSILVGNVGDFFSQNYNKDNLLRTVIGMESDLFASRDWGSVTTKLDARMQRALLEAFLRFHRTLLERLGKCLSEGDE